MGTEILTTVESSGVTGVLIVGLWMLYRSGNFFAPLITGYISQQAKNTENINSVLHELAQLQTISNTRLSAIEKQLTLFEGVINEVNK